MNLKLFLIVVSLFPFVLNAYAQDSSIEEGNAKSSNPAQEAKKGDFKVFSLGAEPDAVSLGRTLPVLFTVLVTGGQEAPETIQLLEVTNNGREIKALGDLHDNGLNGDIAAQDRIFSGTFELSGLKEGLRYFQARLFREGIRYASPVYSWTVTTLPTKLHPSDPNMLVEDPKTGQKLYANEVIVSFKEKVPSEKIIEIFVSEKCDLVGTIPSLGVLQVQCEMDKKAEAVYQKIKALEKYRETEYAEPNFYIELDD
jgi:hypothetical protein